MQPIHNQPPESIVKGHHKYEQPTLGKHPGRLPEGGLRALLEVFHDPVREYGVERPVAERHLLDKRRSYRSARKFVFE
jgi:hypothetical protein